MANIKDKNRILKAAREKQCISIRMSAVFFQKKYVGQEGLAWYALSDERKKCYNQ